MLQKHTINQKTYFFDVFESVSLNFSTSYAKLNVPFSSKFKLFIFNKEKIMSKSKSFKTTFRPFIIIFLPLHSLYHDSKKGHFFLLYSTCCATCSLLSNLLLLSVHQISLQIEKKNTFSNNWRMADLYTLKFILYTSFM